MARRTRQELDPLLRPAECHQDQEALDRSEEPIPREAHCLGVPAMALARLEVLSEALRSEEMRTSEGTVETSPGLPSKASMLRDLNT